MPCARESPQTLCSVFAGYGLNQPPSPSAPDQDLAWDADLVRVDQRSPFARSRVHVDPSVVAWQGRGRSPARWCRLGPRSESPTRRARNTPSSSATNSVAGSELSLSTVTGPGPRVRRNGTDRGRERRRTGVGLGVGLGEAGGEYDGDTPTIWIDSTICRTSDLTVSAGAESVGGGDHQANTIDIDDPDDRCSRLDGDRPGANKPLSVGRCTPGTPLDSHRACRIASPRCRCSAAPRNSSRDRRSPARGAVRSCLCRNPPGCRRPRSQGQCPPRRGSMRDRHGRSSRRGRSSRDEPGMDPGARRCRRASGAASHWATDPATRHQGHSPWRRPGHPRSPRPTRRSASAGLPRPGHCQLSQPQTTGHKAQGRTRVRCHRV